MSTVGKDRLLWVVRYHNGSEYSNLDGPHHLAPRNGVQEVWYADERCVVCTEVSPAGLWVWREGQWMGCDDQWGFWDYMFHYHEPDLCVLFGRTLADKSWEARVQRSIAERLDAQKLNWTPRERRGLQ